MDPKFINHLRAKRGEGEPALTGLDMQQPILVGTAPSAEEDRG
jgi:hypothetical protein